MNNIIPGQGQKFTISGGTPLKGEIELAGAKNSGFKLMIASLLSSDESHLEGFSKIGDVLTTAKIIEELGGRVKFGTNHCLEVEGHGLKKYEFSEKTGRLSRASTYFIGPLLHLFGKAVIPVPGGCKIGQRPLDRHLEGFKALGAEIKDNGHYYEIKADKLKGTRYRFAKNTHGGTDVMLIASVYAEGETILENAAQEPEVDDLINFLNSMGANIQRKPGRKILIKGVEKLHGTNFKVMPDRNEAVTFACAALITKGDVFVKGADKKVLESFLEKIKKINGGYEIKEDGIRFYYKGELKACSIVTKPHPDFMTDWQALWAVLMTQADGTSSIHETIFENRFAYVNDLINMGANIEFFKPLILNPGNFYNFNWNKEQANLPHAIRIVGQTKLHADKFTISDLRAGATLILAAMIAEGETELKGIEHVDRGYEDLDGRLRKLGAKIKREGI